MRFRTLVAEAWRSLAANASTTLAATLTVLIAMLILGLSIGLGTWALSWSNHVKRELVVHVYFCTQLSCGKDATPKQEERLGEPVSPSRAYRGEVGAVRLEGGGAEAHAAAQPRADEAVAGQSAP